MFKITQALYLSTRRSINLISFYWVIIRNLYPVCVFSAILVVELIAKRRVLNYIVFRTAKLTLN
jgi:hypothetical protein